MYSVYHYTTIHLVNIKINIIIYTNIPWNLSFYFLCLLTIEQYLILKSQMIYTLLITGRYLLSVEKLRSAEATLIGREQIILRI